MCNCNECFEVLRTSLAFRPDLHLVLKAAMSARVVVPAVEALALHDSGETLESVLTEPGDWLREVFIAEDAPVRRKNSAPRKKKRHLRLLPKPPTTVVE